MHYEGNVPNHHRALDRLSVLGFLSVMIKWKWWSVFREFLLSGVDQLKARFVGDKTKLVEVRSSPQQGFTSPRMGFYVIDASARSFELEGLDSWDLQILDPLPLTSWADGQVGKALAEERIERKR